MFSPYRASDILVDEILTLSRTQTGTVEIKKVKTLRRDGPTPKRSVQYGSHNLKK